MSYRSFYEAVEAARDLGLLPGGYNIRCGKREWINGRGKVFVIDKIGTGLYDLKPAEEVAMCIGGEGSGGEGGCGDEGCVCNSEAWADLDAAIQDGGAAPEAPSGEGGGEPAGK